MDDLGSRRDSTPEREIGSFNFVILLGFRKLPISVGRYVSALRV